MRALIAMTLLVAVACSRNRDGDARTLVDELERLDTSVEEICETPSFATACSAFDPGP